MNSNCKWTITVLLFFQQHSSYVCSDIYLLRGKPVGYLQSEEDLILDHQGQIVSVIGMEFEPVSTEFTQSVTIYWVTLSSFYAFFPCIVKNFTQLLPYCITTIHNHSYFVHLFCYFFTLFLRSIFALNLFGYELAFFKYLFAVKTKSS